jgi:hypothetical protein
MLFLSIPNDFSSFNKPLKYLFDIGAEKQDVEVKIIDHLTNEVIGSQMLYGITRAEVDIAPYLRQKMHQTMPDRVRRCGEVELGQNIIARIEVNGMPSSERRFIAADVEDNGYQLLTSQQYHRTMACDEFDIISWVASYVTVEVVVESFGKSNDRVVISPTQGGQRAVAITAQGLGEDTDELRVTILTDGVAAEQIIYDIKPNLRSARRLAWLNEFQAPELYTFPLRKGVLVKATRKYMESLWGREAAALESENELKLISAYEPAAQIKALADILRSKRVWLVEGDKLQSVNLLTDRVLPTPCGEMGMIEVDVRAAEEGVRLW